MENSETVWRSEAPDLIAHIIQNYEKITQHIFSLKGPICTTSPSWIICVFFLSALVYHVLWAMKCKRELRRLFRMRLSVNPSMHFQVFLIFIPDFLCVWVSSVVSKKEKWPDVTMPVSLNYFLPSPIFHVSFSCYKLFQYFERSWDTNLNNIKLILYQKLVGK